MKGKIEMQPKYHMTKEQNIFLAKRNIVDYIWKSANLEGIGVTYPDTQAIYNDMSVAGYKVEEIDAVNDLKHAWQLLLSTIDVPLNLAYVKKLHLQLGRRTVINAGSLRLSDAYIGGTNWIPDIPDEMKLERDMEEIKRKVDILDRALNMTLYLMRSQIFYDGNKRLSMMIGNKIMIENGMGIISVPQDKISGFYDRLIPFYETGDLKEIKQFLYDFCIDGMEFPEDAKIPEK
jgi:prophage maintenance system killer protein/RNAse (barnase) inhibitor barstar